MTGGSNIQFAVNPDNGDLVIIEMNPRVSRSSALASKATGFPIAKIAAKLAIGFTLDEIRNDITKQTPSCFEPAIDYCVVKMPRFAFEKFPKTDKRIGTQMKSVGEVMSIGRTFKEAIQKAMRSLEIGSFGFDQQRQLDHQTLEHHLTNPSADRLWHLGEALREGYDIDKLYSLTGIDPWFLSNIELIIKTEEKLKASGIKDSEHMRELKELGFSDNRLAALANTTEDKIRAKRIAYNIRPVYKRVDTCAAEFEANTPYLYSTYEEECEAFTTNRNKIMILGGGPNRIGQGIEFDYCCVHGVIGLAKDGFETIMVNCNPETVSTDYDTADRLYFEPLAYEDVMEIIDLEKPQGVIVQFGGQTPLNLAIALEKAGAPIIGTSPAAIHMAEDRESFKTLLMKLGIKQPPNGTATSLSEAREIANQIEYPVVVRPSYVLGGRAMEVVYDDNSLNYYMTHAVQASPEHPILIDKFLSSATELDVDAICDGEIVVIAGVMEHIEQAGVHSGDSACSLPPHNISKTMIEEIKRQTTLLALELKTVGLINIQFAIQEEEVYVLEANPRASRTIPFVSKSIGQPLAQLAARVMAGKNLHELGFTKEPTITHIAVKESVFPFTKFIGVDTILGPEMRSTGEVMGIDKVFGKAFGKASLSAGTSLPSKGCALISVTDEDKAKAALIAGRLAQYGFTFLATPGTARVLEKSGIIVEQVMKVGEGKPDCADAVGGGLVDMVINTTRDKKAIDDSFYIRRNALMMNIPYFTTMEAANAATDAIEAFSHEDLSVLSLQEYYEACKNSA